MLRRSFLKSAVIGLPAIPNESSRLGDIIHIIKIRHYDDVVSIHVWNKGHGSANRFLYQVSFLIFP